MTTWSFILCGACGAIAYAIGDWIIHRWIVK